MGIGVGMGCGVLVAESMGLDGTVAVGARGDISAVDVKSSRLTTPAVQAVDSKPVSTSKEIVCRIMMFFL
jgi:hypothetical protein